MSDAKAYRCPCCNGELSFEAGEKNIVCSSCNNAFPIEAIEISNEAADFNWKDYKADTTGEFFENTRVYNCVSCGARIEADQNTAATRCPYCESNVVLADRVSGGLKPNAVIPFKIKPSELSGRVKAYYKNKRLLPRNFFSKSKLSEIQGIYVPFWLYSAKLKGAVNLTGDIITRYSDSDYDYTETSTYLLPRDGEMTFENVPIDASVKMDNAIMDSLEPFDFSEMVKFDEAYLAGFLADRFDSSPDEEHNRVNERMTSTILEAFSSEEHGYENVSVSGSAMKMENANIKYVLLPVYLIHLEYGGEKLHYAVNGQTGKVVGKLPVSKAKIWQYFTLYAALLGAIGFAVGMLTQW